MIILPKQNKETGEYILSYTQISTWLKSKNDYIKSYFLNERFEGNAYTEFGTKVGEALENNDFSNFAENEIEALKKVKRLDEFEKEIIYRGEGYYVIGYIDTNDTTLSTIIDYKTGGIGKEEEYKKEEYIQPIIYAMALKQQYNVMPKKAEIYFMERIGNPFRGEPLALSGNVSIIDIPLTEERINYTKNIIDKVAKEISEYYKVFLKLNENGK